MLCAPVLLSAAKRPPGVGSREWAQMQAAGTATPLSPTSHGSSNTIESGGLCCFWPQNLKDCGECTSYGDYDNTCHATSAACAQCGVNNGASYAYRRRPGPLLSTDRAASGRARAGQRQRRVLRTAGPQKVAKCGCRGTRGRSAGVDRV